MKKIILTGLLCSFAFLAWSQDSTNCGELVLDCCQLSEDGKALNLSVAATRNIGIGYAYPYYILLDNQLDTIAISKVKHYGIPGYLVTERLELKVDTLVAFEGTLQVISVNEVSCSIPFSFNPSMLSNESERTTFAGFTVDQKSVMIDIQNLKGAEIQVSMANRKGEEIFNTQIQKATTLIPTPELEQGVYHIWIHDKTNKLRFTYQLNKEVF